MPKSTAPATAKPEKPSPTFPLFAHATGRWCKKIRGKLVYFGPWNDPDGALRKYQEEAADLHSGRVPNRHRGDALTVRDLLNSFLTSKKHLLDTGALTPRTFADYKATCARLIDSFGRLRLVSDLKPDDFEKLRAELAKTRGPVTLANEIQRVRSIFKYAADEGKIDRPMIFGQAFRKPPKREMRLTRAKQRAEHGLRMLARDELLAVLKLAGVQQRAMILLAANGGLGAADLATLPKTAFDLKGGWLDYPRAKTGVDRRFPLWPETVSAVQLAFDDRPAAAEPEFDRLAFLTRFGKPWIETKPNGRPHDAIGAEFNKLLKAANVKRAGVRFYALRHGFQTVADEAKDFLAVRAIMGHAGGNDVADHYRERISDERLRSVVDHVRGWLLNGGR